jgi:formyltetrahydrofolate deformylase
MTDEAEEDEEPRTLAMPIAGVGGPVGTLIIESAHRKGIVTSIAQLLNGQGATILDSNHYSDRIARMFFQRIVFDLTTPLTDRLALEDDLHRMGERIGMRWRLCYSDRRKRVAIFASKQEHCLYDLLIRHRAGELACDITMVISNHPDTAPIAKHFNIPFHHLPVTEATKQRQEAAIAQLIDRTQIDLIILARYMQILSPGFVEQYPARIINIHHSFLPAFVGANPYRQAYEKGVKMIGATSHYVTHDLDQGPIIEQATVRCAHRDSVEDLIRKGRDLEKQVLAAAVRLHLEDRVLVWSGKTVIFE